MPNDHKPDLAHGEGPLAGVGFVPMDLFDYLIPIGLGVVFLTLCFGIYTLFRGGDFSRSWSNKAMRFRVLAQFVVILILVAAMLWKQNNG